VAPILQGEGITKRFGGLVALDDVDVELEAGEILGLVGPNGSGKTTLLNVLTGRLPADAGTITFDGEEIRGLPPNVICRKGLVKTNQIGRPLTDLTVLENVAVASVWGDETVDSMREARVRAQEFLDFVGIGDLAERPAGQLTHTPNRRMEVARALATNPSVLLLDEVAAGHSSEEIGDLLEVIRRIRDELDVSLLWVEHVMEAVMEISERVVVLQYGELIAQGTPEEIASNDEVQRAYLGGEADA